MVPLWLTPAWLTQRASGHRATPPGVHFVRLTSGLIQLACCLPPDQRSFEHVSHNSMPLICISAAPAASFLATCSLSRALISTREHHDKYCGNVIKATPETIHWMCNVVVNIETYCEISAGCSRFLFDYSPQFVAIELLGQPTASLILG